VPSSCPLSGNETFSRTSPACRRTYDTDVADAGIDLTSTLDGDAIHTLPRHTSVIQQQSSLSLRHGQLQVDRLLIDIAISAILPLEPYNRKQSTFPSLLRSSARCVSAEFAPMSLQRPRTTERRTLHSRRAVAALTQTSAPCRQRNGCGRASSAPRRGTDCQQSAV